MVVVYIRYLSKNMAFLVENSLKHFFADIVEKALKYLSLRNLRTKSNESLKKLKRFLGFINSYLGNGIKNFVYV